MNVILITFSLKKPIAYKGGQNDIWCKSIFMVQLNGAIILHLAHFALFFCATTIDFCQLISVFRKGTTKLHVIHSSCVSLLCSIRIYISLHILPILLVNYFFYLTVYTLFFIRTSKFCLRLAVLNFFHCWGWNVLNLFLFSRLNLAMPQRRMPDWVQ